MDKAYQLLNLISLEELEDNPLSEETTKKVINLITQLDKSYKSLSNSYDPIRFAENLLLATRKLAPDPSIFNQETLDKIDKISTLVSEQSASDLTELWQAVNTVKKELEKLPDKVAENLAIIERHIAKNDHKASFQSQLDCWSFLQKQFPGKTLGEIKDIHATLSQPNDTAAKTALEEQLFSTPNMVAGRLLDNQFNKMQSCMKHLGQIIVKEADSLPNKTQYWIVEDTDPDYFFAFLKARIDVDRLANDICNKKITASPEGYAAAKSYIALKKLESASLIEGNCQDKLAAYKDALGNPEIKDPLTSNPDNVVERFFKSAANTIRHIASHGLLATVNKGVIMPQATQQFVKEALQDLRNKDGINSDEDQTKNSFEY